MPTFSYSLIAFAVSLTVFSFSPPALAQTPGATLDIASFRAPEDGDDWAPAFRRAVGAAGARGGGAIRVPTGNYALTSPDPTDGAAHVVISLGNIELIGDARGFRKSQGSGNERGTNIYSTTPDRAIFKIMPPPEHSVTDIVFRNLKLSRSAPAVEGGCGILFADNPASKHEGKDKYVYAWDTLVENLCVVRQYDGVRALSSAQANSITVHDSIFTANVRDGIHLDRWGDVVMTASDVGENGGDGIVLENYSTPTSRFGYSGTAQLVSMNVYHNAGCGLRVVNHTVEHRPRDIHLSACQFDLNGLEAISVRQEANLNIAGCSFTANSSRCADHAQEGACTRDAVTLEECEAVSIAACTFQGNSGGALRLRACHGAAISGCTLSWNNNASTGPAADRAALAIVGGTDISASALTFTGTGRQRRGVLLEDQPANLVMSALTFSAGMDSLIEGKNVDRATGRIEFWRPAGKYGRSQAQPGEWQSRPAAGPW